MNSAPSRSRLFILGLALALAALCVPAHPPRAQTAETAAAEQTVLAPNPDDKKVFNAQHYTLENGLEIYVIPNHRAPVVTHMVWYKVGAADEAPGKSGIAHFLEHLMFKGTNCMTPGAFSEIVRALGGNDNAFTSQDYTAYFQSVAASHLAQVMRMEADRMRGLNLLPSEVDSERQVILEERRERTDNNPQARFAEQLASALFVNHPYGTPIIGWAQEMEQLSRQDALDFYRLWYAPNNAILIVSGDVEGDDVHLLAKEIFGPLKPSQLPPRARPQTPPLEAVTTLRLEHPYVQEPVVQIAYRVPSFRQNPEMSRALQVLEEIMGGGPTSRLYQSLVVRQKIASAAGFSYDSAAWDQSMLTLYAVPLPGQKPEAALKALEGELRLLLEKGVSDAELRRAKNRLKAGAVYALDSLSGPAMIFGQSLSTGSSLEDLEYWPRQIETVTAAQIAQAANAYLNPDHPAPQPPVIGILTPPAIQPKAKGATP